jgi:hypothetical protein
MEVNSDACPAATETETETATATSTIHITIRNRRRHAVTCVGLSQEGDVEVPAGATVAVVQTLVLNSDEGLEVRVDDASINDSVKGTLRARFGYVHLTARNWAPLEPTVVARHTVPFRDSPDVNVKEWLITEGLIYRRPRWIPIVLKWKQVLKSRGRTHSRERHRRKSGKLPCNYKRNVRVMTGACTHTLHVITSGVSKKAQSLASASHGNCRRWSQIVY